MGVAVGGLYDEWDDAAIFRETLTEEELQKLVDDGTITSEEKDKLLTAYDKIKELEDHIGPGTTEGNGTANHLIAIVAQLARRPERCHQCQYHRQQTKKRRREASHIEDEAQKPQQEQTQAVVTGKGPHLCIFNGCQCDEIVLYNNVYAFYGCKITHFPAHKMRRLQKES